MFRRILLGTAALALMAAPVAAQTVDEIVAKHVAALGGAAKLKAIKTKKITGKASGGGGPEIPVRVEQARPEKMRLEFDLHPSGRRYGSSPDLHTSDKRRASMWAN